MSSAFPPPEEQLLAHVHDSRVVDITSCLTFSGSGILPDFCCHFFRVDGGEKYQTVFATLRSTDCGLHRVVVD